MDKGTQLSSDEPDTVSHTPGPWVVRDSWYIQSEGGVGAHASVHNPISPKISDSEHAANARLIASAPDLFEALQLLWKEVVESGNGTANDYGWKHAREKTLAALDKATGGEF